MLMTKVYDFWKELEFGHIYEKVIEKHLKEIDEFHYVCFETEKQLQLDGIDYLYNQKPIRKGTVELKIRRPVANEYNDIGIEIWSVHNTVRGWGFTSTAEYIIYAKLAKSMVDFTKSYIIENRKLRTWLQQHEKDTNLQQSWINNNKDGFDYKTVFLLVPVELLDGIIKEFHIELTDVEKIWIKQQLK